MGLREVWAAGGTTFGAWCMMPGTVHVEALALAGFDYLCIDCQHGLIGYDQMVAMLQAMARTDTAPVVRVPANDWSWIGKALDAGAEAVIVPMVNSRSEAEQAGAACRYPPHGLRSYGPTRRPAADPVCLVMIETAQAVEAADEICGAEGVDGVYVGPSDLAVSLGYPPSLNVEAPDHAAALERVRQSCETAGIVPGIHAGSGAQARARAEAGFRMVTAATDMAVLGAGARRELKAARLI